MSQQKISSDTCNLSGFLAANSLADYDALLQKSDQDPNWFWNAVVRHFAPVFRMAPTAMATPGDISNGKEWLPGAVMNIADTCLRIDGDRFPATDPAIAWESEDGDVTIWNRQRLRDEVGQAAQGLSARGVGKGDRVGILMPMLPETIAAYLAVASLGAVAVPLFSGYGADAVVQRLSDAEAKALITVESTRRRGRDIAIIDVAQAALARVPTLSTLVVVLQAGSQYKPEGDQTISWRALTSQGSLAAQPCDAETLLMVAYTSGTSGKPKGTVHAHGGFLLKVLCDLGLLLDIRSGDRVMWMGDFGWLTGPILAVGVLSVGGCLVLAEGAPDYPSEDRVYQLLEKHRVSVFSLSPTLVRSLMVRELTPEPETDLSSLRVIASTGEAWRGSAWAWCAEHFGRNGARILNYTGGTEIGGTILSGNLLLEDVPGSVGKPAPGMGAMSLCEDGTPAPIGEVGELVLGHSSPGLSRGLWKAEEVFRETYCKRHPGRWSHGDLVERDAAGYWHMKGRRDDVMKVAGKRIAAAEVEAVAAAVPGISEVAVVSAPDDVKGERIVLFCIRTSGQQVAPAELSEAVANSFGTAFRPSEIHFVPDFPRTRTNKVMRNILKRIAAGEEFDASHVANADALDAIQTALADQRRSADDPSRHFA
ncbi:AMP-binding protein [Roseivivax sp. CAU 1761]